VKTPIASFLSAAIWSLCLQGASGLSALPTPPSAPPRNAASAKATPKTTAKKKSVSRAAVAKRASRPAATNRAAVKTNAARRVLPAFPTPPKRIAPPSTNRAGKPSSPARTAAPPARRAPALPAFPQLPTPPRPQTPAGGPRPPAAPPTSAAGGPPIQPVSTNYSGLPPTAILEGGTIDFPAAPLDQVLEFYAELTGRTVLRPAALPAAQITLRTQGPLTKEEAVQALDTVLALNGITMINVGEKFVTAVPTTQALQEGAAFTKKDASQLPEAGQFVTKTVQLKHILPSDAVQILQSFSKIQNGLLPIDNAQTLVIRDYAANVKRMMEILEKIDVEEEQDYQLAVIPIKYGKVTDIYGTMNSLITGAAAPSVASTSRAAAGRSSFGGRFGTGSPLGGRNSSSYGSRYGGYGGYGGGLYRPYSEGVFRVQQLRSGTRSVTGTSSSTFAQRLRQIASRRSGQQEKVELLADARIVPDERSNSLIVFASKKDIAMITNLVSKVDRLQAQVLIDAIIMDIQLSDEFELGVSTYLQTHAGDWSHGFLANSGPVFNTITNLNAAGGLGWVGSYKDDLSVLAKALASTGKGQIIATPRIQTSHATPANFRVGQTVPYVTSTYYGGSYYGPSASFSQLHVDTELDVTPYITPDGLVVMEIRQTISEIAGFKKFENVGELPETVERSAAATVSVRDGDTIILGGYIRSNRSRNVSGVPLLKDIPLLGALFRSKSSKISQSETILLLRPTILSTPEEAAALAESERRKLPGVSQAEEEMPKAQDRLRRRTSTLESP